jgi:hypothetical protein
MTEIIIPDPIGVNDPELAVMRRQTSNFIKAKPTTVTLLRGGTRDSDGAGGFRVTPGPPIGAQVVRLIPQGGNVASRNIDGEEINPAYVMIAGWDADVKKGDVFERNGRNHEVMFVRPDEHKYETWAEVVYRG